MIIGGITSGIGAALGLAVGRSTVEPALADSKTEQWVDAGQLADIPEGKPVKRAVTVVQKVGWGRFHEPGSVWVIRNGEAIAVFSAVCPHLGCSMKLVAVLSISAAGLALLTFLMSGQTDGAFASSRARTYAAALIDSKCAMCHGKDGRGTEFGKKRGAPDFSDSKWQQSRTDLQITDSISNGREKGMPEWKGKLSSEEIASLVARVRDFAGKR